MTDNQDARNAQVEHLLKTYETIWPEVLKIWWFLDLPSEFGWRGTLVDGTPTFFAVARMSLVLDIPLVGMVMEDLARSVVERAVKRAGWTKRPKAPQLLGACEGSAKFEYLVLPKSGVVELTGGLGYRVL